jgi:hypothetical protein
MSIELVESEIRRFLSTEEAEVVCISGKWGVGKTFAWNRFLKWAQAEGKIALNRYAYVSLFGLNSLDELKYAVFENSVKSSDIGLEPSLENLRSNTNAAVEQMVRKSIGVLEKMPFLKNYIGGASPMLFAAIRSTVICIDDFERRGRGLSVRDVLGLINNLKEHKACKVCLILNDDALEEDEHDFRKYLEKVVDTSLKFVPSAQEATRIALGDDTETAKMLTEDCVALGISNIRLIKRVERSVRMVEPILKDLDNQVLREAAHSLALLVWATYEPDKAPSVDFLRNRRGKDYFGIDEKRKIPEKEAAWNALLDAYRFQSMDEFDLALLQGVRDGFFDASLVKKHASALNDRIKAGNLSEAFFKTWETFHDSFDNNQDEVLEKMYESFEKGVRYIAPQNMNGTVALFKALGRSEQATQMIKYYVESRKEEAELFDLRHYPLNGDVTDPDVVRAFNETFATKKIEKDPATILLNIANTDSWSPDDIIKLSLLPAEDYYKLFKGTRGTDLRRVIDACLQFDRIMNGSPEMREISKRAKEALRQIGKESAINARRVKAYGIDTSEPDRAQQDIPQS